MNIKELLISYMEITEQEHGRVLGVDIEIFMYFWYKWRLYEDI